MNKDLKIWERPDFSRDVTEASHPSLNMACFIIFLKCVVYASMF